MSYFADRDYVHAKIHALHGYLLRPQDYTEMISTGSVQKAVPGLPPEMIRDDCVAAKEFAFRHHIGTITGLCRINRSYRRIFLLFLRIYELSNLKVLLSKAMNRGVNLQLWYDITPYQTLHRDLLQGELTPQALYELISHTWLSSILPQPDGRTYDELELCIDSAMAGAVVKSSAVLIPRLHREIIRAWAALAAFNRITWEARLGRYFGLDEKQIEKYMDGLSGLSGNGRGVEREIRSWEKAMRSHVLKESAGTGKNSEDDISALEMTLGTYILKRMTGYFYREYHSVSAVICYLVLYYYQIRNVSAVIEGIRFGYPRDELQKRIIGAA